MAGGKYEMAANKIDTSLILRLCCVIVWAIAIVRRYGKASALHICVL